MSEKKETQDDDFLKMQIKKGSHYLRGDKKRDFKIICARIGSTCNAELSKFVDKFIKKNKHILNAKRQKEKTKT